MKIYCIITTDTAQLIECKKLGSVKNINKERATIKLLISTKSNIEASAEYSGFCRIIH